MAWIKFEKDLLTDPRVLRIARSLQARWIIFDHTSIPSNEQFDRGNASALPAVTLVCGALIRIWSLADTHLGEDELLPLGFDELNEVVGIPGFCELMPADWIISIDEHTVKLPEFHEHNGTEAKKKAVTQKRVERFRKKKKTALQPGNGKALPDHTIPDHINTAKDLVNMGVEERIAKDWLVVRKAKHAPLTDTALKAVQDEAAKAGLSLPQAIAICATRSWQGFKASWLADEKTDKTPRVANYS